MCGMQPAAWHLKTTEEKEEQGGQGEQEEEKQARACALDSDQGGAGGGGGGGGGGDGGSSPHVAGRRLRRSRPFWELQDESRASGDAAADPIDPAISAGDAASPEEDESGRLCPESGKAEKAGTPCAETSLGGAFVRGRLYFPRATLSAGLPGFSSVFCDDDDDEVGVAIHPVRDDAATEEGSASMGITPRRLYTLVHHL